MARARAAAAAKGVGPEDVAEDEVGYLTKLDGMLFGDDPQQGFVQGRRFAHPVMRIGFEAPEGFTLTNSPQAIFLEGPQGQRGEFGGGVLPRGGLEAYAGALLAQTLGEAAAQVGPARRLTVNGLPAIVVPVDVRTEQGTVSMSVAAYDGGAGEAYHFVMVSATSAGPSPALESLFGSFRLLSADEAAGLRPRRLQVVRAGRGDTTDALAARMATDFPVDTFLMLNARSADQPVRPGELLKIVSVGRAPGQASGRD